MEIQNESSNSEIISPENNYKFDNYGIVVANSIEDLLYDKYRRKKHKNRTTIIIKNKLRDNFFELSENDSKISNKRKNSSSNKSDNYMSFNPNENNYSSNQNSNFISILDDSEFKERAISHNISLEYQTNIKSNNDENIDNENNINNNKDINKNNNKEKNLNNNKDKKIKKKKDNNENSKANNNKDNNIKNLNNKEDNNIKNKTNNNNDKYINNQNDKDTNKNNSIKINKLKMIRSKEFQINRNNNNNNKEQNKKIKIILNIDDKEEKEIEIDPHGNNLIKNININNNKIKSGEENSDNLVINNKNENNNLKKENEESKINDSNELNNNFSGTTIDKNNHSKRILKNKKNEKKFNNVEDKKDFKNIKKIHLISSSEKNNKKDNKPKVNTPKDDMQINNDKKEIKEKENKAKNMKNIFYNIPIPPLCYLQKIRKTFNINFKNSKQKKEKEKGKTFTENKMKNQKKSKIISFPNIPKCFFIKDKKIIYTTMHIPLQNVINNNYFITKEISKNKKINIKLMKYKSKANNNLDNSKNSEISSNLNNTKSLDNINNLNNSNNNNLDKNNSEHNNSKNKNSSKERKNKKIKKKEDNNLYTEIDIDKTNKNSPNIIIKIINPLNSAFKYGKIDIKTKSAKKLGKSKSSQNILYNNNNLDDKNDTSRQSYLINFKVESDKDTPINNNKIKLKKIKNLNNNRYENKKDSTDNQLLKNQEIVNALNNSTKYKVKCPACITLNRRKQFSEKIFKNLKLKVNKNVSKSQKNSKIPPLKPEFNINNIKNKLWNVEKEEHLKENNKINRINRLGNRIYMNNYLFPKTNTIVKSNINNSAKQNNNFSYYSINNILNNNHIEFPAIDSYFH